MTETELDSLYGELCRALSQVGEAGAALFLARFALLAIDEIDNAGRVRELLASAVDLQTRPDGGSNGQPADTERNTLWPTSP
jgi:hypothetical protein